MCLLSFDSNDRMNLFIKLTLLFQEVLLLIHSVIKFYFYIIFEPVGLATGSGKNILADIFNGLTPMVLSCCLARFNKRDDEPFFFFFFCSADELSRVSSLQLINLLCLLLCPTSHVNGKLLIVLWWISFFFLSFKFNVRIYAKVQI